MVQSVDLFSIPLLNLGLLLGAFVLLLSGAEIFTNSVEWFGRHLGLSESATGSILADVAQSTGEVVDHCIAVDFVPQIVTCLPSASIGHELEKRVETAFSHSI